MESQESLFSIKKLEKTYLPEAIPKIINHSHEMLNICRVHVHA